MRDSSGRRRWRISRVSWERSEGVNCDRESKEEVRGNDEMRSCLEEGEGMLRLLFETCCSLPN